LPVQDGTQTVSPAAFVSLTGPSALSAVSAAASSGSFGSVDSPGQPKLTQSRSEADKTTKQAAPREAPVMMVTVIVGNYSIIILGMTMPDHLR